MNVGGWPCNVIVPQGALYTAHTWHTTNDIYYSHVYTVFARSDAAATIYFIAHLCAAFIREWCLFIPEAILREMVD